MTQKAKKLDKTAQTPSGDAPYDDLRGRVSDEFLKSLSAQSIVKPKNINENIGKLGKYKKLSHDKIMKDEEQIRLFIINNLKWPEETANTLAPIWAKSCDSLVLPERAPVLYKDRRDRGMDPITFLEEQWGKYIKAGLMFRDDLNRLDPRLQPNIESYCQRMRASLSREGKAADAEKYQAQNFLPPSARDRVVNAAPGSVEYEIERKKRMRRGYTAAHRGSGRSLK